MSLIPLLLHEEYPHIAHRRRPGRLLDHLTLTPSTLLSAINSSLQPRDYHPTWRQLEGISRNVGSTIKADKDKFQVNLDVQHFAPEEISVKTADGYVVVQAKHEEKQDEHGFVSRQFVRRYALPKSCNAETVESRLTSDGVLTVTARKQTLADKGARPVPIVRVGPVRRKLLDNTESEDTPKKKLVKK